MNINIKNKFIKERDMKDQIISSNRYVVLDKNCDSNPALLRGIKENIHGSKENMHGNKENNINHFNLYQGQGKEMSKSGEFQKLKSNNFTKKMKTLANEVEDNHQPKENHLQEDLKSSQEYFAFKNRNTHSRHDSANFGENLTFGIVSSNNKRNALMTSREFQEEKRIKNEILEEKMSQNMRRNEVSASTHDLNALTSSYSSNFGGVSCTNHSNKNAKYKLISQGNSNEEELLYCSKCAINLLQQGFKIEEIHFESENNSQSPRRNQMNQYAIKIKILEQKLKKQLLSYNTIIQQESELEGKIFQTEKQFNHLIQMLNLMKVQKINQIKEHEQKKLYFLRDRQQNLNELLLNFHEMESEIKQYRVHNKYIHMNQNQYMFLLNTIANKVKAYQQTIKSFQSKTEIDNFDAVMQGHSRSEHEILMELEQYLERNQIRKSKFTNKSPRFEDQVEMGDDFPCDEEKKPFRNLFPEEDIDFVAKERMIHSYQPQRQQTHHPKNMLNSFRECARFAHDYN